MPLHKLQYLTRIRYLSTNSPDDGTWGEYEIDEAEKTISYVVRGSLFPNWVGGEQLRYFEFEDEQLVLTTPPIAIGDDHITGVLTWSRSEQGGAGTSAV